MRTDTIVRYENPLDFDVGKALFYIFLFLSLFMLIDPFYTGYGPFRVTRDLGPFKYTALVFGIGALYFSLMGMLINAPRGRQPPFLQSLVHTWPILLLGILVLIGSLVARFHLDIHETFLQLALGILGIPIAIILFWSINDRMLVARRFLQALLVVMPVIVGWVMVKRIEGGQAFHLEIFLFVPISVYFFHILNRRWLAWLILLTTIMLGIASHKNTAYLVMLLTLTHLWMIGMARSPRQYMSIRRALLVYGLLIVFLTCIAVISFLLLNREDYLPHGNVEVRTVSYAAAINRFLNSPFYGTGFLETTLVPLVGQTVLGRNTIITHSDVLDILSHGGLIGAALFLLGIFNVFYRAVAVLRSRVANDVQSMIHGLGIIVVCGLVTASFNSPLLTLPVALLFWFAFGLLSAVADYGRMLATQQNADPEGAGV